MKTRGFRPDAPGVLEPRLALSGPAAHMAAASSIGAARGLAPPPAAARFEIGWMGGMIAHHGMAVRMARLALDNSGDAEVRSLARGIVRAQAREIADMQRWLAGWYGVRGAVPRPSAADRAMLEEMRGLRGEEFDRMFLAQMIGHHRAAIAEADRLLAGGSHPRLLQLGRDVIATQSAEVARMQALLGPAGAMGGGG